MILYVCMYIVDCMYSPYLMSGTVMELSAMFVASMIFLCPGGALWNTLTCSSAVIVEWSGRTHHLYEEHSSSPTFFLKYTLKF